MKKHFAILLLFIAASFPAVRAQDVAANNALDKAGAPLFQPKGPTQFRVVHIQGIQWVPLSASSMDDLAFVLNYDPSVKKAILEALARKKAKLPPQ